MPRPCWVERVDSELARRGVPARFRRRLLAELRDHADELTDQEGLTMTDDVLNERLGQPAELAARAAAESRRATWVARHPLLVFALLPLPATLLAFVATVTLYGLTAYGAVEGFAGGFEDLPRPTTVARAYGLAWSVRFVPFALLAALFTRLYLRHHVRRGWFVGAAMQVLALAGTLVSAIISNGDEPGQSMYVLQFLWIPMLTDDGWAMPLLAYLGWTQALQVLVPLSVIALMLRTARRREVVLSH